MEKSSMSTQTRELISFFQKAFQAGTVERDPEKYLAKYRSEIEAAGKVFQYLELATPDSKAALGWKPTKPLLDLIAKSNAGPSKTKPKPVEVQVLLDLMMDTMLGSDRQQGVGCFCVRSLIKLGLVDEDSWGDHAPTIELLNLFTSFYYFRAWGVRNPNAACEVVLSGAQ
jgi:hypothetical protein